MRVNNTLEAEQKTGSVDPYVPVEYYTVGRPSDGGGEWLRLDNVGSVARIIDPLDYSQEPYGALATIHFHNEDSAFDAADLRGKWIRIGWGMVCGGGNEISYPPYLKCIGQDFTSKPEDDEDTYITQHEGAWNILERFIATSSHFFNQPDLEPALDNKTGKQIADYILELAGLDLGADIGTLDGKITTWKPKFDVPRGENGAQTMRRLLAIFKCVLIPRTDCMHLKYCQAGDAVDYTYKVPQDASYHPFISGQSRSLSFKPMKVKVQDKEVNPTYTGEYADSEWTADMGYLTWADIYGVVTSDADCVFIAEAEVARAKSNAETGWIFVPIMNCLQELYDKVTTTDDRGNTGGTGRVGGIYAHYRPGHPDDRMRYCCEIRLGGLQKTLPTDMQAFVDQLGIGITTGIPGNLLLPHSIPANALRQACQKYDCDIVPDPTHADYTWEQIRSSGGTIHFSDDSTLSIDAITLNLTTEGYGDNPVCLYFIQGNSTLQHTDDWTKAVGKDRDIIAIVQRAELTTAEDKASWDGHTGKLGVMNTRVLLAAIILAGHIRAGELVLGGVVTGDLDNVNDGSSYGRVLMTHLDASGIKLIDATLVDGGFTIDKIGEGSSNKYFSGKDLDDLPNGSSYGRILLTHISAGKIKLIAATLVDGGFTIDKIGEGSSNKYFSGKDLDDLPNGASYGRVLLTSISAGKIVLAQIDDDATYKKYLLTERSKLTGVESGADVTGAHQAATVAALTGLDLDDLLNGATYGRVLVTDISAGHILLAEVLDGTTYKKYLNTERTKLTGVQTGADVTGTHQSATTASLAGHDLEDLPDGATYVKVKATDISAGHLKLTTSTVVSGEWYNESGVEIDAAHGINIYGVNNALTTRATKTGTIQCYVGADGKIYAGAGAVYLDATGLNIRGQKFLLRDSGGTIKAEIGESGGVVEFKAAGGAALQFTTGNEVIFAIGDTTPLRPTLPNKGYLGTNTYYWRRVYAGKIYLKATSGTALECETAKTADIGSDSGPFDDMFADDFVNKSPRLRAIEYLPMLDQIRTHGPHNEIKGGLAFPCTWAKPHNPSKKMHTGVSTKAFIELTIGCLGELRAKVERLEAKCEVS